MKMTISAFHIEDRIRVFVSGYVGLVLHRNCRDSSREGNIHAYERNRVRSFHSI